MHRRMIDEKFMSENLKSPESSIDTLWYVQWIKLDDGLIDSNARIFYFWQNYFNKLDQFLVNIPIKNDQISP